MSPDRLAVIGRVEANRHGAERISIKQRSNILQALGRAVCSYWAIESSLYWVLDPTLHDV